MTANAAVHIFIYAIGAAIAIAIVLALSPWGRRAGRALIGWKRLRSRVVCAVEADAAPMLLAAEAWLYGEPVEGVAVSDNPAAQCEALIGQIVQIQNQITQTLLPFGGFWGFSPAQRELLREMDRRLNTLGIAIRSTAPSYLPGLRDLSTEQTFRAFERVKAMLDRNGSESVWPSLKFRYRFWPARGR